jgi:hypothetical protein
MADSPLTIVEHVARVLDELDTGWSSCSAVRDPRPRRRPDAFVR